MATTTSFPAVMVAYTFPRLMGFEPYVGAGLNYTTFTDNHITGSYTAVITPSPDGKGFILNGTKRWITNGGISQVLTLYTTPVIYLAMDRLRHLGRANKPGTATAAAHPPVGEPAA